MPQFDFSTYSSQIFWLLISFTTLYFLLWRYFLPKFNQIIQERTQKIDEDHHRANLLFAQIKDLANQKDNAINKLKKEIALSNQTVIKNIQQEHTNKIMEIEKQFQAVAAQMRQDFQSQQEKILSDSQSYVDQHVKSIMDKIQSLSK